MWRSLRPPIGIIHFVLLFTGLILGGLAVFKTIPIEFSFAAVLSLIPCFTAASSMNADLIPKVIMAFDFWLLFGYLTVFVVAFMVSLNDERAFAVGCGYCGFVIALLADALPERIRKSGATVSSFSLLIIVMLINYALFQEKVPDLYLPTISMGKMSYTSADIAFLTCFNCCIFLIHFVFTSLTRLEGGGGSEAGCERSESA